MAQDEVLDEALAFPVGTIFGTKEPARFALGPVESPYEIRKRYYMPVKKECPDRNCDVCRKVEGYRGEKKEATAIENLTYEDEVEANANDSTPGTETGASHFDIVLLASFVCILAFQLSR